MTNLLSDMKNASLPSTVHGTMMMRLGNRILVGGFYKYHPGTPVHQPWIATNNWRVSEK
jgi:hypothetical protein